jgi:hypothetical protein
MTIKDLEQYKYKLEELTFRTQGCWWYQGTKDKNGRGRIRVGKKMKNTATLAWELFHEEILPEGFRVKNTCENLSCVNPAHLELIRRTFPWRI